MGQDIFAAKGDSADVVTVFQNSPASPRPTPILSVDPEQGTFLRFLNQVAKGSEEGIPVYADLRDSNGDPLPLNTTLFIEIEPAGMETALKVSETLKTIQPYQTLSISDQRDEDNVDAVKITLEAPETSSETGAVPKIDVRDIDTLTVSIDSAAQIDWSQSQFYFESNAVEQKGRR